MLVFREDGVDVAQSTKSYPKSKKVAQNRRSCSKVDEQNVSKPSSS